VARGWREPRVADPPANDLDPPGALEFDATSPRRGAAKRSRASSE
jgi:hypothetical protein